jgi:uncharacterized protein
VSAGRSAPDFVVHCPPPSAARLFGIVTKLSSAQINQLLADGPHARLVIEAAAHMGLARAQVQLGRMLLEGTGGLKDETAAYEWFKRAAARGNADACNMVGRCLENGWGAAIDCEQAAICYRRAAQAGDSWAQYNLGHFYLNGVGVRRDPAEALHWYQESAGQGHPRAMNLVGRCYEQGWGVTRDLQAASVWYRASAEAGYFRGQYNYASVLMSLGRRAEAVIWLRHAVTQAPSHTKALIMRSSAEQWNINLATVAPAAS